MAFLASLRERVASETRRRSFLRLVRLFCTRALSSDATAGLDVGVSSALAFLAVPGAFTSILLVSKYSSLLAWARGDLHFDTYRVCLPDEYFFVIFSMAITGLIMLLRWDQLLPDARDFANLAVLPLSLSKIFLANVLALALLALLFAVDINLVSTIIFPLLVTLELNSFAAHLEFTWAHILTVLGISSFTFLTLIALQGILMALFRDRLYRRVSTVARVILMTLLLGVLISVFLSPLPLLNVNHVSVRGFSWWPPLWFLSLFQSHVGRLRAASPFGSGPAVIALGSALLIAALGFLISYKRYFLRIPELQTGIPTRSERVRVSFQAGFALFGPMLQSGLEKACFQFTVRTLFRSETHLLVLGLWTGLGLLLSLQELQLAPWAMGQDTIPPLLFAPVTFGLFTLGGLRFIFDIPSQAQANWPFRLLAEQGSEAVRTACRKLMIAGGIVPLMIWLPFAATQTSARTALCYLLLHLLLIGLIVEALLWRFRKVPFTCEFTPGRDRLLKILIGSGVTFVLVLPLLGQAEARALHRPIHFFLLSLAMVGATVWLFRNGNAPSEILLYEDRAVEPFALLRLGGE